MDKKTPGLNAGTVICGSVALLLAVYLLLPIVYVIPLGAAYRHGYDTSPWERILEPIEFLTKRWPAYDRFVARQMEWVVKYERRYTSETSP